MITVYDYIQKAKMVRDSILDEQGRIISSHEFDIIRMNTKNIEEGKGSDGNFLINTNKKFTGFYTMATHLINPKKTAGSLYNFFETGAFLSGFQVNLDNSLTKVNIFSNGTGSGQKSDFFRGYKNIFGLDKQQSYELNYNIILPELNKFINKYL